MAERTITEAQFQSLLGIAAKLREIQAGSGHTGIWRGADGTECDEGDVGATWEEFTDEEQGSWLSTVADTAGEALGLLQSNFAGIGGQHG